MRKLLTGLCLIVAIATAQTAKFPATVATDAALMVVSNRVQTTLLAGVASGDTTFAVVNASRFTANMLVTIDSEIAVVCTASGNLLTIGTNGVCPSITGRGFDSTSAASHAIGATVSAYIDAWHHNAITAEIKAIETALGPNLNAIPTIPTPLPVNRGGTGRTTLSGNSAINYAVDFNWTPQVPGGSLTASIINTVTLTPCPVGLNGTDLSHYLEISLGSGTAEPVLISGGTCTSGLASGTVLFTPAFNHSGVWQIASATAGIQEALQSAGAKGRVQIGQGTTTTYAKIVGTAASQSLRGFGPQTSVISFQGLGRAMEFATLNPGSGPENHVDIGSFAIIYANNGTSGEGLYLQDITDGTVSDLVITSAWDCLTLYSVSKVVFRGLDFFALHNGVNASSNPSSAVTGVTLLDFSDVHIVILAGALNPVPGPNPTPGSGFVLGPAIAGGTLVNVFVEQGVDCIQATSSTSAINEVQFNSSICDNYSNSGVNLLITGTGTAGRWSINNNLFNGGPYGVLFRSTTAGAISGLNLKGNSIGYGTVASTIDGIRLEGVRGGQIANNMVNVSIAAGGGQALELNAVASENIAITNNSLGLNFGYGLGANQSANGLFIGPQAHRDIFVAGNQLVGSVSALTDQHTGAFQVSYRANAGVDDMIPALASAATLTLPVNQHFTYTGTTTCTLVNATNLFKGKTGTFIPAGIAAFTAGASIGNSFTTAANTPVTYLWDGAKLWLK